MKIKPVIRRPSPKKKTIMPGLSILVNEDVQAVIHSFMNVLRYDNKVHSYEIENLVYSWF